MIIIQCFVSFLYLKMSHLLSQYQCSGKYQIKTINSITSWNIKIKSSFNIKKIVNATST